MFIVNRIIEVAPGEYAPSQTLEFVFTNRSAAITYAEHVTGFAYPAIRNDGPRPAYYDFRDEAANARAETFEYYSPTRACWAPLFEIVTLDGSKSGPI